MAEPLPFAHSRMRASLAIGSAVIDDTSPSAKLLSYSSSKQGDQVGILVDAGALIQEIGSLRSDIAALESSMGLPSPKHHQPTSNSLVKSKLASDYLSVPKLAPLSPTRHPQESPSNRRPLGINRPESPDQLSTRSSESNPSPSPSPAAAPLKPSPLRHKQESPSAATRGEAVILEAALDQALPPGAFRAKHYHPLKTSPIMSSGGRSASPLGHHFHPHPHHHSLITAASDPTRAFISSSDPDRDFDALEAVQREAARQASASCADHGRILIKVAERFREMYQVLRSHISALSATNDKLRGIVVGEERRLREHEAQVAKFKSERSELLTKVEDSKSFIQSLEVRLEHEGLDREEERRTMQMENGSLRQSVDDLQLRVEELEELLEKEAVSGYMDLKARLVEVEDERDGHAQRLRFLERQVIKMREELNTTVPTEDHGFQTDPPTFDPLFFTDQPSFPLHGDLPHSALPIPPGQVSGSGSVQDSSYPMGSSLVGAKNTKLKTQTMKATALGGFAPLLLPSSSPSTGGLSSAPPQPPSSSQQQPSSYSHAATAIPSPAPAAPPAASASATGPTATGSAVKVEGRIRGIKWTLAQLAQIYQDKAAADALSDRRGDPHSSLCTFTYEWQHTKANGHKLLAENNLLDLIASVRQHGKRVQRLRWFGRLTGVIDGGEAIETSHHLTFYLFALTQLSLPSSLSSLFVPDGQRPKGSGAADGDTPIFIKSQVALEASRAVFKFLNDPEAAGPFLAKALEASAKETKEAGGEVSSALAQSTSPLPGAEPGGGRQSSFASSGVRCDSIVRLFMLEYEQRLERNVTHIAALFRAADSDRDGQVCFEEFILMLRHMKPEASERFLARCYAQAERQMELGHFFVTNEVFTRVAHSFGLDRWQIDTAPWITALQQNGILISSGDGVGVREGGRDFLSRSMSIKVRKDAATNTLLVTSSDKVLQQLLEGTLSLLEPSLETLVTTAMDKLTSSAGSSSPSVAWLAALVANDPDLPKRIEALHSHLKSLMPNASAQSAVRRSSMQFKGGDTAGAWLAFRVLHTAVLTVLSTEKERRHHHHHHHHHSSGGNSNLTLTAPGLPPLGGGDRSLSMSRTIKQSNANALLKLSMRSRDSGRSVTNGRDAGASLSAAAERALEHFRVSGYDNSIPSEEAPGHGEESASPFALTGDNRSFSLWRPAADGERGRIDEGMAMNRSSSTRVMRKVVMERVPSVNFSESVREREEQAQQLEEIREGDSIPEGDIFHNE